MASTNMAYVSVSILSATHEEQGPLVLRSTSTHPTTGTVYDCLEYFYREVGSLTDDAGRYMRPAEDYVLEPGNYTFQLAGNLGTSKAGRCSMDVLLRAPLPRPGCTATSVPMLDGGPPQSTHPTVVMEWPNWQKEVKTTLGTLPKNYQSTKYERTDEALAITGENEVAALLQATACQRINTLFATIGDECSFSIHPCRSPREGADKKQQWTGVQIEPEEEVQGLPPDICLIRLKGTVREILQTTLCKAGCQLMNLHNTSMPALWNAVKNGHLVPDMNAAQYVVSAIAQELGHMSRRGHKTGVMSSYNITWLLKTDGKGCVWISDPVAYDCPGTQDIASATEVLLFSALSNLRDAYAAPYPTAKRPGELPSMLHFNASMKQARAALLSRHHAYDRRIEAKRVSINNSKCKRLRVAQKSALVPLEMLHLTTRLAPWVFLGSVGGRVAAVRLATTKAAIEEVVLEAKVYEQMQHLQGQCVPRILNHGFTLEGKAYFVATEFLVGIAWDWDLPAHDAKLRSALDQIHAACILHRDLHIGNILVTPESRVFVLDFAGAMLNPTAKQVKQEMKDLGF